MAVDIVIVSYNTKHLLRDCLESVAAVADEVPDLRTVVVDNGGRDGSDEMVRTEFPDVLLVRSKENLGFGGGNNRGLERCDGEYVLFLNSDAQLTPGALPTLLAFLKAHPHCVAVGPRLIFPDGAFQPSCRRYPTCARNFWSMSGLESRNPEGFPALRNWLTESEHQAADRVDLVSGACFLARREYIDSVGRFDENLFLYEEEPDLFLPLRGTDREVRYCSEAVVIHNCGSSVKRNNLSEFSTLHRYRSKYCCFRKHYGRLRARIVAWTDAFLLGFSTLGNRLRRRPSNVALHYRLCREAYRRSFGPARVPPTDD